MLGVGKIQGIFSFTIMSDNAYRYPRFVVKRAKDYRNGEVIE